MAAPAKPTIITIDLLRFICALSVVGFHFGTAFPIQPSPDSAFALQGLSLPRTMVHGTWFGWIGVELFFVISGFVIAISAANSAPLGFFKRRALRLAPAAWVCATATLIVLASTGASPLVPLFERWGASLAFLERSPQIDPSYWTLGIELYFYLFITAGLFFGRSPRHIEGLTIMLGAISTAFWLVVLFSGEDPIQVLVVRQVQLLLLVHGCFFALGALIWAMIDRGVTAHRVIGCAIFYSVGLIEITTWTNGQARTPGLAFGVAVPILLFTIGVVLILGSVRFQPWLAKRVPMRHATTIGLMTYPLYLLHQEIGARIIGALMNRDIGLVTAALVASGTAILLAWLIARFVEPALRRSMAATIDAIGALMPCRALVPDTLPNAFPRAG